MNRMTALFLSALFLAVLTGCAPEAPKEPNVLFLFADDQRADTIGAWGNSHIRTPNMDRLVNEGFSFRSNYNMGANGGAVCVPSRVMVNTGKAYFRVPNDMGDEVLMPQLLAQNGYATFGTGKWHNQRPSWLRGFGKGKGKNVFFGGMADHTKVPLQDLLPDGTLGNDRVDGFSSELFADAVIEFLKGYNEDKPFYAYVAFTAPHDPRQPPESYRQTYYDNRPPLPKNFMPHHPFDNGHMGGRDENLAAWPRTEDVVSDQLAEYYGMITHLDDQIGRILAALEETGKYENTIIVYAADHGLAVGSHGLLGKQSIYEHSQKCPLIFVGPGIPKGQSSEALTYLLDIFPTVASLTGVTPPAGLDGHDLSAIWSGEKQRVRNSLFLGFKDVSRSVRDDQYKLILYPQINHTQLFDLKADPDELNNLAEDPAESGRIEKMTAMIQDWQKKLGDDKPLRVDNPQPKKKDMTGTKREPDKWQPEWIVKKYF